MITVYHVESLHRGLLRQCFLIPHGDQRVDELSQHENSHIKADLGVVRSHAPLPAAARRCCLTETGQQGDNVP